MADADKVIRGIERCLKHTCPSIFSQEYSECEYTVGLHCGQEILLRNAINVIKEQQEQIAMMKMAYGDQGKIVGELVRCKDCKWWTRRECGSYGTCINRDGFYDAEWYCADGERRDAT